MKKKKKVNKTKRVEKDFYTTNELVKEKWFPARSTLTVLRLIKNGKLKAVDVSTSSKSRRYRILKKSAKDFSENVVPIKKTIKKK